MSSNSVKLECRYVMIYTEIIINQTSKTRSERKVTRPEKKNISRILYNVYISRVRYTKGKIPW